MAGPVVVISKTAQKMQPVASIPMEWLHAVQKKMLLVAKMIRTVALEVLNVHRTACVSERHAAFLGHHQTVLDQL